jgi:hypothetical protein
MKSDRGREIAFSPQMASLFGAALVMAGVAMAQTIDSGKCDQGEITGTVKVRQDNKTTTNADKKIIFFFFFFFFFFSSGSWYVGRDGLGVYAGQEHS